jgi:hypothetical protein
MSATFDITTLTFNPWLLAGFIVVIILSGMCQVLSLILGLVLIATGFYSPTLILPVQDPAKDRNRSSAWR